MAKVNEFLFANFALFFSSFHSTDYPDSSTNTAKLAGIGVCALVFYLSLQLILIGLWHQKYRQENPNRVIGKSQKHNESSAHLQSSMENNESYDYSYQQPMNYPPMDYPPYGDYANPSYGDYANPPYVSNTNEQMLLQQPGAAVGTGFYEPVVWPSNVEVEAQPDAKFLQPMDWSYGAQPTPATPSTGIAYNAPVATMNVDNTKCRIESFVVEDIFHLHISS